MGGPPGIESNHIQRINVLSEYESSDHAMYLIRKVASLVLPIMKKRNYVVRTLTEFWDRPEGWETNGVVLGWNRNFGETVALRLREIHDHRVFLKPERIVETMLHELSHMIWTEHDNNFYGLLKEHEWEWEQLTLSGFTGDPSIIRDASHNTGTLTQSAGNSSSGSFTPSAPPPPPPHVPQTPQESLSGEGKVLGGNRAPTRDESRLIGLAAAETRRRIQEEERQRKARARKLALVSYQQPTGNRLGGKASDIPIKLAGKSVRGSDRAQIAAAAERRRCDAVTCGSGRSNNGERRRRLESAVDEGIRSGIQVRPEPLSREEMQEILLQIQVLEEAERLRDRDEKNHSPPSPHFRVNPDQRSGAVKGSTSNSNDSTIRKTTRNDLGGLESPRNARSPQAHPSPPNASMHATATQSAKPSPPATTPRGSAATGSFPVGIWSCLACTLINPASHSTCSVCETPRGSMQPAGVH